MKAKLNFNIQAIQGFLLAHGEKFAFGLVVLLMLMFISGAMDRSGYDKNPEELKEIARRMGTLIDDRPAPPPEDRFTPRYGDYVPLIREPVDANRYRYESLWTPFIWPQPAKRTQPLLYTVRDLRGAAGHGAVRVRPNPANPATLSGVMGQRWVVVTGLIPYEEQFQAYVEAFGKAEYQDSQRDVPRIIYYVVERAEVESLGQAGQVSWTRINLRSRFTAAQELWNGTLADLVNPKYIHQGGPDPIAFPLPPIETGAFGREIAHHPEIPLAAEELAEAAAAAAEEATTVPPPVAGDTPLIDVPQGFGPQVIVEELVEEEPIPYRLFRFFDFDVQPGKHYRYRVKLMLANPNYNLERRYLAQDDLRDAAWLETDWSNPTEPVGVPRDARVLVGSVKPPAGGRVTSEPKATLGIPYFFYEAGVELYERQEVSRGKYLNFPNRPLPEGIAPIGFGGESWLAAAAGTNNNSTDPSKIPPPTVNYNTESVLLDMVGGERLNGRDRDLNIPGRVLLMDPDGNLVVQDELEDKGDYEKFQPPEEAKPVRGRDRRPSEEEEEALFDEDEESGEE